jgi:membrane protein DedA with SNARE-associated domain
MSPAGIVALFVAEALAWAGVPMIGAAAMGAAGVLASQGSIDLWVVLVVGTAGAELGAWAGWWIGNRVARAGRDRPGRFAARRNQALDSGEKFSKKWGRLVVFFVPSWVSGAIGMPFGQFARWNILAAALWMIAAGLGAYGVGSAASGGSLTSILVPLVLAAAACALVAFVFVRWHAAHVARRQHPTEAL